MVKATNRPFKRFFYTGGTAVALWLLVVFLVIPRMAVIAQRVGITATLLIVFVPLTLAAGTLLVSTYQAWAKQIQSIPSRRLALTFFWFVVGAFVLAGLLFVLLVIARVDSSWTFTWN